MKHSKIVKKISIAALVFSLLLAVVGCSGGAGKESGDSEEKGEKFSGEITIGEELESGKYDIKYPTDDKEKTTIYIYDAAGESIDSIHLAKNYKSRYITTKEVAESYVLKKGYKLSIDGTAEFVLLKAMDIADSASSTTASEDSEESEAYEEESSSSSSSSASSSSSSSSTQKVEKITSDTSGVTDAIKSVDKKYDEMIKTAQGYVDNPSTYSDSASLVFLGEYTELMIEYAKLGEAIEASGEEMSSSDALTMYNNLLVKSAKLTELYSQLG